MSEAAYELALTLRVKAGGPGPVPYGSAADSRLKADLHALLAAVLVTQHVWGRSRGYMKTTSAAVAAVASLLVDAPANSIIQVFSNDQDQSRIIMQAIRTIVAHLPSDAPPLTLTLNGVTREDNGAQIRIETSDAASSLGAMNLHMLILDEYANWKDVPGLKSLWDNVYSGVPKTGSTKVLIVTSAGPIGTWAYERLMVFQKSPHWRYSHAPGPAPWRTAEDLEKQREGLSSQAAFRMFHLNEFTSAEDGLVTQEDLTAAVSAGARERPYDPAHRYIATADLGVKKDPTVLNVCHREGNRVVQDVHRRFVPRLGRPVSLTDVRDELVRLHEEYSAPIRIDPSQALQMVQEMQAAGVGIETVAVSVDYNHRCTTALQRAFDQHRIDLLDIKDQTDELLSVVVRTATAGARVTVQIDSAGSGHDDQADCLAMAVEYLMANPWFDLPVTSNLNALAGTQVKRATGALPAPHATRERVRLGKRDLSTPAMGQPRGRGNDPMAAYARYRQRTSPEPGIKTRHEKPNPTGAAPPAA